MVVGVQDKAGQMTWRGMILWVMNPFWVLLPPRAVTVIGMAQGWVDIQALLGNLEATKLWDTAGPPEQQFGWCTHPTG